MNVRRLGLWFNLLLGGVLMLAVWVMLVWVASRPALKALIDLTPQRINSVDPVTVELLQQLRQEQAEIEFHLFYQDYQGQAPDQAAQQAIEIRGRLVDLTRTLLVRYQYLGAESVKTFEHTPYADTAKYREAAQAFGYTAADSEALVVAVRMPGKERRHRKLSLVSDLAVIDLPQQSQQQGPTRRLPVPVLKDYKGEAQITSALKGLLVQGTPIAYVLKGYSTGVDFGITSQLGYGGLLIALEQSGFEVRELNLRQTAGVPSDAALVLVIEPRSDFAPRDAEALFDYVKRGGRLFLNYAWSPLSDFNPTGGRLGELLGYELSEQPIFHKIPDIGGRAGGSIDGNDGVARLAMQVNQFHPTTRRLAESGRAFEVAYARQLREAGAPGEVRREPLMVTGDEAWLAVSDANGQPDNRAPRGIRLRSFVVGLACSVDVAARDDDLATPSSQPRSGEVVIMSGVFCNNGSMPLFGNFALNVCNWMAERKVLIDIAGSRYEARYLTVQPQQLDRIWSLLVFYVPGAFLLFGLIVWWRRRH